MNAIGTRGSATGERATMCHLAASRAHDALVEASCLLFTVSAEMERVGEEGAAAHVISWESGIAFIARAMSEEGNEVYQCLQREEQRLRPAGEPA